MHLLNGIHGHPIRIDEQQLSTEYVANRWSNGGHCVVDACNNELLN